MTGFRDEEHHDEWLERHPIRYEQELDRADIERKQLKEDAMELEVIDAHETATLFHTDDPDEVVAQVTRTADTLAKVIADKKLYVRISDRDHVRVEGWTLLGTMLGVFPYLVWSQPLEEGGWEARVEARTKAGQVVGSAEAQCTRSEKAWANRDDYALRSMAQTRATSKALRQPLGFVISLAGFDPTPADEMPSQADAPFQAPKVKEQEPALSVRQQRKIHAILDKLAIAEIPGFDDASILDALQLQYDVKSVSDLTAKDAADLITRLEAKEKEHGL